MQSLILVCQTNTNMNEKRYYINILYKHILINNYIQFYMSYIRTINNIYASDETIVYK